MKSKFAPALDIKQDQRRDEEARGASEAEEARMNGLTNTSSGSEGKMEEKEE